MDSTVSACNSGTVNEIGVLKKAIKIKKIIRGCAIALSIILAVIFVASFWLIPFSIWVFLPPLAMIPASLIATSGIVHMQEEYDREKLFKLTSQQYSTPRKRVVRALVKRSNLDRVESYLFPPTF